VIIENIFKIKCSADSGQHNLYKEAVIC